MKEMLKKSIASVMIFLTLFNSFGAFTEFYTIPSGGSSLNSGSDANSSPKASGSNGNWNATTDTYIFSGATDLSTVTTNDYASIYPDGSTITTLIARVTSVNDGTDTITVTATASRSGTEPSTAATGISCRIGGAWSHGGTNFFPFRFTGDNTFAHVSSSLTNGLGLPVRSNWKGANDPLVNDYIIDAPMTNTSMGLIYFEAYQNTPGDNGMAHFFARTNATQPLAYAAWTLSSTPQVYWKNFWWDQTLSTNAPNVHSNMVNSTTVAHFENCLFTGSWEAGLVTRGAGSTVVRCSAIGCNVNAASGVGGFFATANVFFQDCLSAFHKFRPGDNGCDAWYISNTSAQPVVLNNCAAIDNWGCAINQSGNGAGIIVDSFLAHTHTLYGAFIPTSSGGSTNSSYTRIANSVFINNNIGVRSLSSGLTNAWGPFSVNNFFYQNTNGNNVFVNPSFINGETTLAGDPFVSALTGNFNLAATAAGNQLRQAGRQSWLQVHTNFTSLTRSFPDAGPAQNQPIGGSVSINGAVVIR